MTEKTIILAFINGAIMIASLIAGLLFARGYKHTRDRFFKLFSAAFVLLSIERLLMVGSAVGNLETQARIYVVRCIAFLIIIYAVIDKNKSGR